MEDFDRIKNQWNASKAAKAAAPSADEILQKARNNYSYAKLSYKINILILSFTCIGISAFFYFVAPMQDTLSRIGIFLMVGGLLVRIIIEMYSHRKASKISYNTALVQSASAATAFYNWRKKIHGPVTVTIVSLYTIGFYALTPEFARHLQLEWLIAFDLSYLVMACFLFVQIRKGIQKEMEHLRDLVEIKTGLTES